MKKICAVVLAVALAVIFLTVNAFAAPETMHDITVYYHAGSTATEVVSVDIAWGAMEFSYYDEIEGTWNPTTHKFDNASPARWEVEDASNYVTITNHSNKAITASLSVMMNPSYDAVEGAFDTPTLSIPTAVDTAASTAPSATARLTLSGAVDLDSLDQNSINAAALTGAHVVGTIMVQIGN